MVIAITPLLALLLDKLLGEPQRAHPLIFLGKCITAVEKKYYGTANLYFSKRQWRGFLSVCALILPTVTLATLLVNIPYIGGIFSIAILYYCLGLQSLHEHARAVAAPLLASDMDAARKKVGWIVSRETKDMGETQIIRATIESVLENGNDAVFATLFWFFLLGAPGAVLLRTANTLDAMWGYKTERYLHFGRFAAKLDDALNWIPARLTAITFALFGNTKRALHCWQTQAHFCSSPNGGPVMAAGAGSLQISLGGGAVYHGVWQEKIILGEGSEPQAQDIERALQLVRYSAWCWVTVYALAGIFLHA
ncbi:MAG TPA: adenosylcobinamide-phosphate synthase CbiB [Pseudomonadales bacterium]|nr:adenosylcobinamide-phosphate synthase CbiB [Pseudomonadales bacterium]